MSTISTPHVSDKALVNATLRRMERLERLRLLHELRMEHDRPLSASVSVCWASRKYPTPQVRRKVEVPKSLKAATGKPRSDQKAYLMSLGLDQRSAREMLTNVNLDQIEEHALATLVTAYRNHGKVSA